MNEQRRLRIALLGAGTVGAQVARLLLEQADEFAARIGAPVELTGIAVRDVDAPRDVELPRELLTTEAEDLVLGADIVIELMGGIEPAKSLIEKALDGGADVVTGNKALLAEHGPALFERAERVGAAIYYEASVAAAIPIIRPLRESLAGDNVRRILAIVNGSTNFILDRMDRFGDSTEQAQATALELGYLEADPTLDVEGFDAAQKAALLASLAFHTVVPAEAVHREGITAVTAADVARARSEDRVIKLLAIAERITDESGVEGVSTRVYPALIGRDHPLASVHGGNNAVFVEAELAGPLMFYGAGAGGVQTASAILGDLVSAARRHVAGGPGLASSAHAELPLLPIGSMTTRYQITLEVPDRAGVLAEVAGLLAEGGVSVETVHQTVQDPAPGADRTATLVIGTHAAREQALRATVESFGASAAVTTVVSVLRVEGAH